MSTIDRLVASGADIDGLVLDERPDGYYLETAVESWAGLNEAGVRKRLVECESYVANWAYWEAVGGEGTARRSFLRWCERAGAIQPAPERHHRLETGIDREWGQLAITTRQRGGRRTYALRHRADVDRSTGQLETLVDPAALRQRVRTDDAGRYRPLSTAPTLPEGWVLPELSQHELVRAVRWVYPATIANWHREQTGHLDVTHWAETANRQTGIYEIVEELSADAVEHLTRACCVDEVCLKRREWDVSATDQLAVPAGDGPFPCREPCALFVATARAIAIAEKEGTATDDHSDFEDQQPAVRRGEVEDPGNLYRRRYRESRDRSADQSDGA